MDTATCTLTTYHSIEVSGTIHREDCSQNELSTTIVYTIPYDSFQSTVSQEAANQLAINAWNANSTAYANANTTCVLQFGGMSFSYISASDSVDRFDIVVNGTSRFSGTAGVTNGLLLRDGDNVEAFIYFESGNNANVRDVSVYQGSTLMYSDHKSGSSEASYPAYVNFNYIVSYGDIALHLYLNP